MQLGILADAGSLADGARAIQLALAPAFLLTAIAGMLNVMTGRLNRVVDRGRRLTESPIEGVGLSPQQLNKELLALEQRRKLAGVAITSCTLAAVLTCLVIVVLFAEVLVGLPVKWLAGLVFAAATVALVVGLTFFLHEVNVAARTVRIELRSALPDSQGPAKPDASAETGRA